ncbi:MAG: glycosyltransferase family 4 protein [Acidobacteria bacterium]|nr:glycosyltransferase family 4 protein [Acidobacteriota bacterium]
MKVLMLLDNPFTNDWRVHREAATLAGNGIDVSLICIKEKDLPENEEISGVKVSRIIDKAVIDIKDRKYKLSLAEELAKRDFDVLHCHDQEMLNIGSKIKKIKKDKYGREIILIYDSHELFNNYPLNMSGYDSILTFVKSALVKKAQVLREKLNGKYIDFLITVNDSLAKNLNSYFHLKNQPIVVRNIPEFAEQTKGNDLRKFFGIPEDTKILVFIGANIYPRTLNLEQVILEFKNQPDVFLVFIARKNSFQKQIENFVKGNGVKNVRFHDIIKPEQILQYLSSADVGLVPTWNRKDLSYWYALDNKLFEYLMAEIPILATKQPEYVGIVEENKIGVCVDPDVNNAYIDGFKKILANYEKYQSNTVRAKTTLNWENESKKLLHLYKNLSV